MAMARYFWVKFFTFLSIVIFNTTQCFAVTQTQFDDYRNASITIGKWLARSTSHNDFYSASPVSTKRAGNQFMIAEVPKTQYASEYGASTMHAPLDSNVKNAYGVIGTNTSTLPAYLELNRLNFGWGIAELDSISASILTTRDLTLTGVGLGYKRLLFNYGPLYISYKTAYSRSHRKDFFNQQSISNDLTFSAFLLLIDVYGGVRHSMGIIEFDSSSPELALPDIKYISKTTELEYFYGATVALTTKLRLTVQANKLGEDYSLAAKISMYFNSLTPDLDNLFIDPRRLKR